MSQSNNQEEGWEAEYRNPLMLSRKNVPHADVVRFRDWIKKLRKKAGIDHSIDGMRVLDLGSGTGRNAYYMAELGAEVVGYEVSDTALRMAEGFARHGEVAITYEKRDIGAPYPLPDESIDIVLDVTSSNSLNDAARAVYLSEMFRVMKPGGYALVRALCKDGDPHAKVLIARDPGADPDSYVHPDLGIVEKTFTKETFEAAYHAFVIRELKKVTHYTTVGGRKFKRNFWVAYLERP